MAQEKEFAQGIIAAGEFRAVCELWCEKVPTLHWKRHLVQAMQFQQAAISDCVANKIGDQPARLADMSEVQKAIVVQLRAITTDEKATTRDFCDLARALKMMGLTQILRMDKDGIQSLAESDKIAKKYAGTPEGQELLREDR